MSRFLETVTPCHVSLPTPLIFTPYNPMMMMLISLEYIFFIFSFIASFCVLFLLNRKYFLHPHIVHLFNIYYSAVIITGIARFIIILHQWGVFPLDGQSCSPILQACLLLRTYYYCLSAYFLPMLLVERSFATYYIKSYEKTKRPLLVFMLTVPQYIIAAVHTYGFQYGYISMLVMTLSCGLLNAAALIMYFVLLWKNRCKMDSLRNDPSTYLTQRYQQEETHKTLMFMRRIAISFIGLSSFSAFVLTVALVDGIDGPYAAAVFESIEMITVMSPFVIYCALMSSVFQVSLNGFRLCFTKNIISPQMDSMDAHFKRLEQQWQ